MLVAGNNIRLDATVVPQNYVHIQVVKDLILPGPWVTCVVCPVLGRQSAWGAFTATDCDRQPFIAGCVCACVFLPGSLAEFTLRQPDYEVGGG